MTDQKPKTNEEIIKASGAYGKGIPDIIKLMDEARVSERQHCIAVLEALVVAEQMNEKATYWFHKPNLESAILLCRDRELVGDDPWVVEPLMKAKTLGRKRWLLRHNPNYVATMKVKPLPQKLFDEYEAIKRSEQVKHAQAKRALQDSEERSRLLMQDWYKDYKENAFTIESMKFYITKTYHVPSLYADRYVSKFRSYLIDQELSEAVTEKHKQAAEE